MAKAFGIALAIAALLALVAALGMLCHGFLARGQMKRYQAQLPARPGPNRATAADAASCRR